MSNPLHILPLVFLNLSSTASPPKPVSFQSAAHQQYLLELEGARRDGLWTDIRKVQQPLLSARQNAAIEYTQYAALRQSSAVKDDEDLIAGFLKTKSHNDAEIAKIRAALKRERALLLLVHAAAMKPKCVFGRKWTQGDPTLVLFPELVGIRSAARLLTAESILMAHDGKFQQAVMNQQLCFRLAQHVASEPVLISYLVAVASQAIALHGMNRILALSPQHPETAASIKSAIQADFQPISPSYALQGETAIFARLMEYTHQMGPAAFA
ncbi:MAG: hypothetical protein JWQ02_2890, partial [Capsulimonas sp.]|nr:hypothetical protein [Capsulimonas sp.]